MATKKRRRKSRPITHAPNAWPWDPKRKLHVAISVVNGAPTANLCGKRMRKIDRISSYNPDAVDCPHCLKVRAAS